MVIRKERNSYTDRRKHTLDENSARAADERGAELFRREGYLNQSEYDRRIHYSARSPMTEKSYSNSKYSSIYGVKQHDKKESDVAAAGDNGGDDGDDADGNDEEGRPSFHAWTQFCKMLGFST